MHTYGVGRFCVELSFRFRRYQGLGKTVFTFLLKASNFFSYIASEVQQMEIDELLLHLSLHHKLNSTEACERELNGLGLALPRILGMHT